MIKKIKNSLFPALPLSLALSLTMAGCTSNELNAGMGIATNVLRGATITNQELAQAARQSVQAMDRKQIIPPASSPYSKRLKRITNRLRYYDGLHLNFKVYQSNKINAYALPDGSVRVFTGLMNIMSDDELVAVIGHEIGHVKMQHTLGQYRKAYLTKAAQAGLVNYGGGKLAGLAGSYGEIGLAALRAQFSQRDELASDAYGVRLLHSLGLDPYAAVRAQQKLINQAGASQGGLLASHPSSQARLNQTIAAARAIARR